MTDWYKNMAEYHRVRYQIADKFALRVINSRAAHADPSLVGPLLREVQHHANRYHLLTYGITLAGEKM